MKLWFYVWDVSNNEALSMNVISVYYPVTIVLHLQIKNASYGY